MTLTRRPTILLIAVVFLVIGAAFLTQLIPYRQILDSHRQVASAESELATLQAENEVLAADVQALETPEEIEKLAREKLGYARPGEIAYVVLDPPEDGRAIQATPPAIVEPKRTWVEKVWDFLSGGDQS